MIARTRITIALLCLAACGITSLLSAQPNRPVRQIQEMLLLEVDNAATRKFSTAQTHLRVGQIREAVELLQSIGDAHAGKLVAVGNGRYVNVQSYAQMLSAGLSPDGLRIYREKLDPVLKPAFEAARNASDEAQLQKILLQGYCCSFSDDALLTLGDLAWDAGDVWRARSYWEQLLPPPPPKQPGEPVAWLAYPDSDLDQALVIGRLILSTIQSGDRTKLRKELAEFSRRFPKAEGSLAGKTGNLLEILQGTAKAAETWRDPVQTSVVNTFAGNPQRFQHEPQGMELGSLRWRTSLTAYGDEPRRGFHQAFAGGPCYFPVVYGDIVFVNNDEQILAYNLRTGTPAWPGNSNDAEIYSPRIDQQGGITHPRVPGEGLVGNIGWPRFTMTISEGRLFARMGTVRPYTGDRGGWLACLDLAHGEGKPVWETYASTLEPEVGGWIFEGSPVVEQGRVYVGLRRIDPQPQSNVACFDALTGKLIWNRKICVGQTNPNFPDFDVNQHLLTWGEGTLYYTTHMGAIAALEPQQGTIKWVVSYPRVEDTRSRHELAARLQRGPLPAMFADGMLYAAPLDSDEVLALDAETGLVKWKRAFRSPIHALLGVAKGLIFASGPELWALSVETGEIIWKAGDADPESHGFGRGLLAADLIYWPTHEEVFVLEQDTGAIRQRLHLHAVHGQSGGNLVMTDGHLLVAQPNGLAVFSDRGPRPMPTQPPKPELTLQISPAKAAWMLARQRYDEGNWSDAATQFQLTKQQARAEDEWMGRHLNAVATEYEVDCKLRQAWALTKSDPSAANDRLQEALRLAMSLNADDFIASGTSQSALPEGDWQLRFPKAIPNDMRVWLTEQIVSQTNLLDGDRAHDFSHSIREVLESAGPQTKTIFWHDLVGPDQSRLSHQLQAAEAQIVTDPEHALVAFHHLLPQLPTPEQRVRAWHGVAQILERQQAWGAALSAWKQMVRVAPAEAVVTDTEREVPAAELLRGRMEQPHYLRQQLLSISALRSAVLTRHWQHTFERGDHTVYPAGQPPAVDLACVLVDHSPVTCLNLDDGKARWQTTLTHSLQWAGYVADRLLLATETELRAVSVRDGSMLWYRRISPDIPQGGVSSRHLMTLENTHAITSQIAARSDTTGNPSRKRAEFALSGETLLIRLENDDVQLWDALEGRLIWQFAARRGLAAGWGLTDRQLLVCQQSPADMVVLDRHNGSEFARHTRDSGPWTRLPLVRDNGSVLTVGALGQIDSWSKPGAWQVEEGPRGWTWSGSPSQSVIPPDVLGNSDVSLLVLDGTMLIAVDSTLGNPLWKTVLGTAPLTNVRSAICCDNERVYVAADGILRAYDLHAGDLRWEQYLGPASVNWKSCVQDHLVFAYPAKSADGAQQSPVTICNATTGRYIQRLGLPANSGDVQLFPTAHTTLLACGNTLCGLGQ